MLCWGPTLAVCLQRRREEDERQEHRHTANQYWNEPLLPAVMKCSLGFFTPIWEKSWFSGRITAPSTACQEREHIQIWRCSVFLQIRRFSSLSQPYLIDWYSSLSFLLLQVPHCADFVSARATNKVHIHILCDACSFLFFLKKRRSVHALCSYMQHTWPWCHHLGWSWEMSLHCSGSSTRTNTGWSSGPIS